ncbi:hypothetical protein [Colwellia sp. 20A7]|jgi:hypothetical protein|uniref:hypothetical protein n=1 Tax=Colwellia sp. 20A7 TaxID=2689569 RepID=UPI00135C4BD4|nr:hypothetical protein [Colwellia sp. 20A7]
MKKFEYICLKLSWVGSNKGISITQFGETRNFSLNSSKKFTENNHFRVFNKVIGILGAHGWELVSISTLMGTDIGVLTNINTTQSEAQEFWFKREISGVDGLELNVEQILFSIFDGATLKTDQEIQEEIKEEERKNKNHGLWGGT